ncbi:heterokaryon incompatibility protein-domain-containing protein, partial [Melanogaster broomeanus]
MKPDFVCEVVQTYFQYATLSHRWRHSGEPQFADISTSIYDPEAPASFVKLRKFCLTAHERGLKWAWCDTCCINKASSSELEEAVTSMFRWYRNSTLTIVYLADVAGCSRQKLAASEWFTRGWTLQELLAPKVMQFYEQSWKSCVKGSEYNHKEVQEWVDTLEQITGIPATSLRNYIPGTDNPREKLRWAAGRTTSRQEDIGYCLIGIFDVSLTPHYGEGDKAFTRLLLKIMKSTRDISLFDW